MIESPVRLRPLRPSDEAAFVASHRAMAAEHFTFGLGYADGMSWSQYLDELESQRSGVDLPEGLVPATFLVAEVAGQLVGRTSIRHELNEFLAREGGHIGYGVVAEYRRHGYATAILRHSLIVARALGTGPRVRYHRHADNQWRTEVDSWHGSRVLSEVRGLSIESASVGIAAGRGRM